MMGNKAQQSWKTCRHVCHYAYHRKVKFTHRYVSYNSLSKSYLATVINSKKVISMLICKDEFYVETLRNLE